MLNFDQYQVLTFDCYGTLIDWEGGVLTALRAIFASHNIQIEDEKILELFAEFESAEEEEYKSYREVLKGVVRRFGDRLHFQPSAAQQEALPNSIQHWQPFPDTVEALKQLKQRFKLVIISNVDDDLFAGTAEHLQVEFDQVITAQQVKSYKPSLNNFQVAFDRIGLPKAQILHVAASLYHDIAPANALELANVWVNRRVGMTGSGAAKEAIAQPNLEVPNLRVLADLTADAG
ncbi:MAG: haloacid dehalogenase type II [Drouetiella hepatica Uher 2000/2452]|jgi:2-haloacid dehalogenase|uniref:Haloacid dehalogenase type II n=1 Tax=Drouetiella hepatica Uher 2000/2452 TaxID=904376 RepID=A0A951Q949_9CYAN|nr:haloacid dehalogenase type II [Drouetiella hepatica Uher 2000/2452]